MPKAATSKSTLSKSKKPKAAKPKRLPFDYDLDYKKLDLRKQPELYRIGKGEQGVLMVEPYKSEILPHWKFANPEVATKSSKKIYELFEGYKAESDFIGCDMARKFIQMGVTRARRYANHEGGKKYEMDPVTGKKIEIPRLEEKDQEADKVKAAEIFGVMLQKVKEDEQYKQMAESWMEYEHQVKSEQTN